MAEFLKTYTEELIWNGDAEEGCYWTVVMAPDDETAERLIGLAMLNDNGGFTTLAELQADSLKDFYDRHDVVSSWGDLDGKACPNCTAHCGRPNGDHVDVDGATREKHVCNSCGYAWFPLGFHEATRTQLEAGYRETIANLDEIERKSLEGEGEDE